MAIKEKGIEIMTTKTKQDQYIESQVTRINEALRTASAIALEGSMSDSAYRGATKAAQYRKLCKLIVEFDNKLAAER